jgi:hypothetical protein
MDLLVQILDPPLEVDRVVTPRLTVDPWRGLLLQFEEARSQQLRCEVVQQVGELLLPIPSRRLTYTQQSARSGDQRFPVRFPALCPVQ